MLKIAICDDDAAFRAREEQMIMEYMRSSGYECRTYPFCSGEELLRQEGTISECDMIFLDISMEGMDGLETARKIREITKDAQIVFVTAFITYALEGYKVNALRYLLKDGECLENAMKECLDAAIYEMGASGKKRVFKFREGWEEVRLADILYIESRQHMLMFHMAGEDADRRTMYARLDDMEGLLKGCGFCRIHKSYLVNLKYAEGVGRYEMMLSGGVKLGISKARFLEARDGFICYRSKF